MQSEKRLVRQLQRGERGAFEEFVDSYGARVNRLVRRYIENPTDAEDVTQEIFCDLYRCIGQFRGESALATWVYRIAVNHCFRHCKRERSSSVPLEDQDLAACDWQADPTLSAAKHELSERVHTALDALSPLHADVVILCELHGLTYQECAKVLEIPVGTVKSRMSNAFRRLRASLGSYVLEDASGQSVGMVKEKAG